MNADKPVGALSDTVGQLNLYAYCNNNPIMYTDPSGEIVLSTALIIIGAIAGVITGGYIGYQAVVNDPTADDKPKAGEYRAVRDIRWNSRRLFSGPG